MVTEEQARQFAAHAGRFRETFESMKPWLPPSCYRFLDIGCGLGGVSMLVSEHYDFRPQVHLIDAFEPGPKWVKWRERGEAYADAHVAAALFAERLPCVSVRIWPPRWDACVPSCELVFSNCSWGHHYPISTYIPLVQTCLKRGGRLIVDLRASRFDEGVDGLGENGFRYVAAVDSGGKKYRRTVWERE